MNTVLAPRIDIEKINILNRYSFFQKAIPSLKSEILLHSKLMTIPSGCFYFQPGDNLHQLALIGSGNVRVYIVNEGGREITLYHLQPGSACPISMLSILLDNPAPAYAIVERTLKAIVIDHTIFKHWTAELACVRQFVFETQSKRLTEVLSLVEDLKFRKLEKRLAEHLLKQLLSTDMTTATIRTTHMQIAAELGSAREVISRLLREFERQDAVHLARGKIIVNNKRALQQILET